MPEKSVAQKLLIKPNHKVLIVNPPEGYQVLLGRVPPGVSIQTHSNEPVDMVVAFINSGSELVDQLEKLSHRLKPGGILWVVYHKGTSKLRTDINRDTINAYAQSIGLQGVAMISINADWSGLRLKPSTDIKT